MGVTRPCPRIHIESSKGGLSVFPVGCSLLSSFDVVIGFIMFFDLVIFLVLPPFLSGNKVLFATCTLPPVVEGILGVCIASFPGLLHVHFQFL